MKKIKTSGPIPEGCPRLQDEKSARALHTKNPRNDSEVRIMLTKYNKMQ